MRTGLLISATLFLALTAAAYAALLEAPAAPQPVSTAAVPFAAAVCCSPGSATEPVAEPHAIREAHSDGGYYYYGQR